MTQGDMSNICNTKRLSCRTGLVGQRRMLPSKGKGGSSHGVLSNGCSWWSQIRRPCELKLPSPASPPLQFRPLRPFNDPIDALSHPPFVPLSPHCIALHQHIGNLISISLCVKRGLISPGFFFGGEQNHRRGGHRSIRRVNPLTLLAIWRISSFSGIPNPHLSP